jgi:hypothetical protein
MATLIKELFNLLLKLGLLEFLRKIGWKAALWVVGTIVALVVLVVLLILLLLMLVL